MIQFLKSILLLTCLTTLTAARPFDMGMIRCGGSYSTVINTCVVVTLDPENDNVPTICAPYAAIPHKQDGIEVPYNLLTKSSIAGVACVGGDIYGNVATSCTIDRTDLVEGKFISTDARLSGRGAAVTFNDVQESLTISGNFLSAWSGIESVTCDLWSTGVMTSASGSNTFGSVNDELVVNDDGMAEKWTVSVENLGKGIDTVLILLSTDEYSSCLVVPMFPGESYVHEHWVTLPMNDMSAENASNGTFAVIPLSGNTDGSPHSMETYVLVQSKHSKAYSGGTLESPANCWMAEDGSGDYYCKTGLGVGVRDGKPLNDLIEFQCELKQFEGPPF